MSDAATSPAEQNRAPRGQDESAPRGRLRKDSAHESVVRERSAVVTLTRTKRLLLRSLARLGRKRRISE